MKISDSVQFVHANGPGTISPAVVSAVDGSGVPTSVVELGATNHVRSIAAGQYQADPADPVPSGDYARVPQ